VHSRLVEHLRPDNPLAQAPYLMTPYSLSTRGERMFVPQTPNAAATRRRSTAKLEAASLSALACFAGAGEDRASRSSRLTISLPSSSRAVSREMVVC
jgi:hypothetical protein